MKKIRVSAPGKIILLGEHAVVYGKPAIIASVAKRCFITLTPRQDKKIEIISENLNVSEKLDEKKIIKNIETANKNWQRYIKTNDVNLLKSITEKPLAYAEIVIGETLKYFNKKLSSGFKLSINSEIPIGSGMGSSAALAVSISGSILLFLGEKFDKEKINDIAFLSEQKKHGLPSGGDNSTCCYGGFVWFRKETPNLKIIQPIAFKISHKIQKSFFTVFTGIPNESTGEMVSILRTMYQKKPKMFNAIFTDQESLTRQLLDALKSDDEGKILSSIKNGQKNLEKVGAVSPMVKSLINEIEKREGVAKICGAGGRTKGTGVLLVYLKKRKEVETLLQSRKFNLLPISLGAEGVREEL